MDRLRVSRLLVWLPLLAALFGALGSGEVLVVGAFSKASPGGPLPVEWRPLKFAGIDRETDYQLVEDDGVVVVRAESRASASGLTRAIEIDPDLWPVVTWRWRIANVLAGGDVSRKEGDDYPARLYITFAYDPSRLGFLDRAGYEVLRILYGEYPPHAAINYIWASKSPVGTMVPNPYSARAYMIVVESGAERVGEWQVERRNLLADYEKAFGEAPPRISGIAIMTDTDDTGESATAWFGDISFHARP